MRIALHSLGAAQTSPARIFLPKTLRCTLKGRKCPVRQSGRLALLLLDRAPKGKFESEKGLALRSLAELSQYPDNVNRSRFQCRFQSAAEASCESTVRQIAAL